MKNRLTSVLLSGLVAGLASAPARASSHREAPFITTQPKVDGTDFYLFNSYEAGRAGFVTLVADYLPLQDSYGGPNYFALDDQALYEIHLDNTGSGRESLTFQFRFHNAIKDIALTIGTGANAQTVAIPLINAGQIFAGNTAALNRIETYTLNLVRGDRRTGTSQAITNAATGEATFEKPVDNIGNKSIPDYAAYAKAHIYSINIPGCATPGKVFVGQRKDPFVVALGKTFDLVNLNPLGPVNVPGADSLADKNVTSLELEVAASCLTGNGPVIGGWTTASVPKNRVRRSDEAPPEPSERSAWTQASRLGMPLVNEVVIGLKDKDRFNASEPKDDAQFLTYVTNPTLPTLLQLLFGVTAPTRYPRNDLVAVFLTGVPGLNANGGASEMLRLNTSIAPVAAAKQSNLGVLGGDLAGFPNGRRPGDDIVDMSLRVVMGVLLPSDVAPQGQLPYTDGAYLDAGFFDETFPYLRSPIPGSP